MRHRDRSGMWRRRDDGQLGELLRLPDGLGALLMSIDDNVNNIVILLGGSDDEETDA